MPPSTPHDADLAALRAELGRYRFIARLDSAIEEAGAPAAIVDAACALLAAHLRADQCVYVSRGDSSMDAADAALLALAAPMAQGGGPALAAVPVRRNGQTVACLALSQAAPRDWTGDELALLGQCADTVWKALERCRIARELRGAEERIRASHDYLRLLINSSDEGFYSVDNEGRTIMCNDAFLKMLGFAHERDVIGKKLHGLIHHAHPDGSAYDAADCPIYHAARDGTPARVENEVFFRADGTSFPVEYRARPVWRGGQLAGAVCTFVDITERKRTEQALANSEAHLSSLFAQTGAGIGEADLSGRLIRMNERYCQLLGRPREQLLGMSISDFTHPDDLARNLPLVQRAIALGEPFEIEKRYLRPDGSVVWVNNTVSPVRSSAGGPVESVLAVSVDISRRKAAEEALRETDRRKDEFLAMLAHELRNPMAPIRAAADLMEVARLEPERLRRTSQIISRQVRHMTALVDDLLDVSRVTRGLIDLERADLDVKGAINDALEQVRPLIEEKMHHLTVDLDPAPAHVLGDHKRLVQILTNLLNNAAKYTPAGGHIHVTMQASSGDVVLRVADTGVGIAPELQARVFELFTQAERSVDRSQGGLGIGLALVKSLAELHGGSVACVSAGAGKGSEFVVTLPRLAPGSAARAPGHAHGGAPAQRGAVAGARVLVVDDNVDAAQLLAMYLQAAGHEVMVEHGSAAALARARRERPDVCVLDIGLPDIDGNVLAGQLRGEEATADAMLIALTGYGQARDRERALAAGFDHFLVKPVDAATVAALVAAAALARQ